MMVQVDTTDAVKDKLVTTSSIADVVDSLVRDIVVKVVTAADTQAVIGIVATGTTDKRFTEVLVDIDSSVTTTAINRQAVVDCSNRVSFVIRIARDVVTAITNDQLCSYLYPSSIFSCLCHHCCCYPSFLSPSSL